MGTGRLIMPLPALRDCHVIRTFLQLIMALNFLKTRCIIVSLRGVQSARF